MKRGQEIRSPEFLDLIRQLPCVRCLIDGLWFNPPIEVDPHHPRGLEFGTGTGLKASDFLAQFHRQRMHSGFLLLHRKPDRVDRDCSTWRPLRPNGKSSPRPPRWRKGARPMTRLAIRGTIIALACVVALAIILPIMAITAPLWAKEER